MGPTTEIGQWMHGWKYRGDGESYEEFCNRFCAAVMDSPQHFRHFRGITRDQRFLAGGRVQSAMGSPRAVTPYNCFVSDTIDDSMGSILKVFGEAVMTMREGGGEGYDFSNLRPHGDRIKSLGSVASGPVSFMGIFDAGCKTIASAGHRRGAQMAVLRVDHPDIERFIYAKQNTTNLTAFNISIGVTDVFMEAVRDGRQFELKFQGEGRGMIDARALWEKIMRSTWDWAEPGVLFIDRINTQNNLWYCETISATNPCGEQPLPPNGACLLGSFNLTKYISAGMDPTGEQYVFDYETLQEDIPSVVRAMDNVIDRARYPLREQEEEALSKRRMGLGVTGLANSGEALGLPYGSPGFLEFQRTVMTLIRNDCYAASVELAKEKGPFPLFDKEKYVNAPFIQTLPRDLIEEIAEHGIRNSHLLSVAPTGTISIAADNVSSGIEPVFSHRYDRTVQTEAGPRVVAVEDYALREWGVLGKSADQCSADDHLNVLLVASELVDSAVSKTCNVSPTMDWEDFKAIYMRAWKGGAKGCTTFNSGGKRFGIFEATPAPEVATEVGAEACYIDPLTNERSCE